CYGRFREICGAGTLKVQGKAICSVFIRKHDRGCTEINRTIPWKGRPRWEWMYAILCDVHTSAIHCFESLIHACAQEVKEAV
ncbi:hypothetical protein GCK32_015680, partial [Trichostrongylus colubriformis]